MGERINLYSFVAVTWYVDMWVSFVHPQFVVNNENSATHKDSNILKAICHIDLALTLSQQAVLCSSYHQQFYGEGNNEEGQHLECIKSAQASSQVKVKSSQCGPIQQQTPLCEKHYYLQA